MTTDAERGGKLLIEDVCRFVDGKTLALVGNAKSLLDAKHGYEIDSHQLVVRFNLGLPLGEPENGAYDRRFSVGSRMDVWSGWQTPDQQTVVDRRVKRWQKKNYREVNLKDWNERVTQVWVIPFGNSQPCNVLLPKTYMGRHAFKMAKAAISIPTNGTTGFTTAWMLLTMTKAAHLNLYGFDGFKTASIHSSSNGGGHHGKEEMEWLRGRADVTVH